MAPLVDSFGRTHDNLRISVTDRCNIRCFYCMPEHDVHFEKRSEILNFEKIRDYIINLVQATRDPKAYGMADMADYIEYGASPRASIYLNMAARAHAFLRRRGYVTPEDIKAIGVDVLRHRVILTYEAEAEEITSEQVVRKLFEHIEVP